MYTKESLETLRKYINLEDILKDFIDFNPSLEATRRIICECPFHSPKWASDTFEIWGDRYTCHYCDARGDALSFLMTYKLMTFDEAVMYLSEKTGIPVEKYKPLPKKDPKDEAVELLKSLMGLGIMGRSDHEKTLINCMIYLMRNSLLEKKKVLE